MDLDGLDEALLQMGPLTKIILVRRVLASLSPDEARDVSDYFKTVKSRPPIRECTRAVCKLARQVAGVTALPRC